MPLPKSVVKVKKDGIELVSNVDRANYLLSELTRAALRDVAKLVRRRQLDAVRRLPGLRRGKRPTSAFQYWIRRRETDLQVGVKHGTWYGSDQELGAKNQPKRQILRNSVFSNLAEIQQIEARYLSAIEDELAAEQIVDEEEARSGEGEEQ